MKLGNRLFLVFFFSLFLMADFISAAKKTDSYREVRTKKPYSHSVLRSVNDSTSSEFLSIAKKERKMKSNNLASTMDPTKASHSPLLIRTASDNTSSETLSVTKEEKTGKSNDMASAEHRAKKSRAPSTNRSTKNKISSENRSVTKEKKTVGSNSPGSAKGRAPSGFRYDNHNTLAAKRKCKDDKIVVTNRYNGTITVIADKGDQFDVAMPGGEDGMSEPMFVQTVGNRIFVGCRHNDIVVEFNANNFDVVDTIPLGRGVSRMTTDGNYLWVINDIDSTFTVVDIQRNDGNKRNLPIKVVDLPPFVKNNNGKPYDIVVTPSGDRVFVSVNYEEGERDGEGEVFMYQTVNYERRLVRTNVGKEPRLSLTFLHNFICVTQTNSDYVTFLEQSNLSDTLTVVEISGANGMAFHPKGSYAYITASNGDDATLHILRTSGEVVVEDSVPVRCDFPHNVVVTNDRLFLVHSESTMAKVTEYIFDKYVPVFLMEHTLEGGKPFGLGVVEGHCD